MDNITIKQGVRRMYNDNEVTCEFGMHYDETTVCADCIYRNTPKCCFEWINAPGVNTK